MPWRYQPVYSEEKGGDLAFGLCEVHFDEGSEQLRSWTDPFLYVVGNDPDDLRGELTRMLMDSWCWVPVNFNSLKPGMTFSRAISTEDRLGIADMIGKAVTEFRSKSAPTMQ